MADMRDEADIVPSYENDGTQPKADMCDRHPGRKNGSSLRLQRLQVDK
jgi:hypothetical protein